MRWLTLVLSTIGVLGQAGLAQATPITTAANSYVYQFLDLTDTVTFRTLRNGNPFEPDLTAPDPGFVLVGFALQSPTAAAVDFGANIYEFAGGPVSDVFRVFQPNGAGTDIRATFVSDVEGGAVLDPLAGSNIQTIIENGQLQSIGTITLADGSTARFEFQSDVEAVATVPEPASFTLLSVGLLGYGWRRRKLLRPSR